MSAGLLCAHSCVSSVLSAWHSSVQTVAQHGSVHSLMTNRRGGKEGDMAGFVSVHPGKASPLDLSVPHDGRKTPDMSDGYKSDTVYVSFVTQTRLHSTTYQFFVCVPAIRPLSCLVG